MAQEYHWPDFHPVEHALIKVSPRVLDEYAGKYQISPSLFLGVTHQGDHIVVQMPGQDAWDMLPDSPKHFFSQAVDVQIAFRSNRTGHITEAVLRQYGDDTVARKMN